ncbi:protein kinase [Pseudomonadota bacterium]|nr:protein kinase [Pseudomonadota bacterium]
MHTLSQLTSGQLVGIQHLTLSENLTSFPEQILSLADSLEILDLSNNQLSSLPDSLVQLNKLKIIFLSNNLFEVLPEVLGQCANLEMIGIKSNKISYVPAQSLPLKLRWLTLTDNQITALPDSLGERPRLQKLMLAGNCLIALPKTLAQAHNLALLRISANDLAEFPDHILSLPKLAWLAFSGNPFSQSDSSIKSVPKIPSSYFTLQKQLGQGASGIISTATWNTPQSLFPTDIAVKKFKGGVTSDGYPQDELDACLKVGDHPNLVQSLAQVDEDNFSALIMTLIPDHYNNLGNPPSLDSCTRDTFPAGFSLTIEQIEKIITQMKAVFEHLHANQVSHGDLYTHNTLFDDEVNILFGDFGAASMYHMLSDSQQQKIKQLEQRALHCFIDDLLAVCRQEDKQGEPYRLLKNEAAYS